MADRALSEAAMLSGLRDIHLPADAPGGAASELAAATGLGLMLALLGAALFHLVVRTPGQMTETDHGARIEDLPEDERRTALLHLLKHRKPQTFERLRPSLYRPDSDLDSASLLRELRDG